MSFPLIRILSKELSRASVTYPQEFNPKIRRWDSAGGFIPITADHYIDVEDGIQVKFSPGPYRTGDYWYHTSQNAIRVILNGPGMENVQF